MQSSYLARYDALVEESSKDPKLAMRDCERKLKKAPTDPAFNLYKAYLLIKQRAYEHSHHQCIGIAKNSRAADDRDLVLELLRLDRKSLRALAQDLNDEVSKILEGHKETLQHAFGGSIAYGFWAAAETAAIGLQKIKPKDKQRQHVRFLASQLYASACKTTNPMIATMRERLLKAMLNKAVEASALTTTQDLRFFLQQYREMQDWNSSIALLDNKQLGLFSTLGKSDIEFVRDKLSCLAKLERWQDVHDFCLQIIQSSVNSVEGLKQLTAWKLDSSVWQHFTDALFIMKRSDPAFDFFEYAQAVLPDLDLGSSSSRIVWVSRCRFALSVSNLAPSLHASTLFSACNAFLERHGSKRYCYGDLEPFVVFLNSEESSKLVWQLLCLAKAQKADAKRWAITELNCLKLQFLLSLSKTKKPSLGLLQSFIVNALGFVRTLKSLKDEDETILEEAFLLIATALQKCTQFYNETAAQGSTDLQAVAILEHALLSGNVPSSYRARLLLITLYRRLGCASLSMLHYQALRIREIQKDTVSHLLYHRVALLHPYATDTVEQRRHKLEAPTANPTLGLQHIIDWYDVAIDRTNGFVSGPVDSLRFDKVQEFLALTTRLQRSQQRQLAILERRRIARLTDRAYDETDNKIDFLNAFWLTDVSDMRDFSRGISLRVADDTEWRPQDVADTQSALYYAAILTHLDSTQSLLFVKDPAAEYQNSLVRLERAAKVLNQQEPTPNPYPEGQRQAHSIIQNLRPLILAAVLGDKPEVIKDVKVPNEKDIESSLVRSLEFVNSLTPLSPPQGTRETKQWPLVDDDTICTLVAQLDCLKTLAKLADLLSVVSNQKSHVLSKKVKSVSVKRLRTEATTRGDEMQNAVQDWRAFIKSDWRTALDPTAGIDDGKTHGGVETELAKVVGKGYTLNTLAPTIRDSMIETLDGIVRIKIG